MPNLSEIGLVPEIEERPHEECGFVGVASEDSATVLARIGIATLQHRGQDSAGMTVLNGEMKSVRGLGLINNTLTEDVINRTGSSHMAIAHTRYSITGSINLDNVQPIYRADDSYELSIAHNGNLINPDWFRERVEGEIPDDASDTVALTQYLLEQRYKYSSWHETLQNELPAAMGGYSAVALTDEGIHGFRDIYSIRPYAFGLLPEGGAVFASESIAIKKMGADYGRPLKGGEIRTITQDGDMYSDYFGEPKRGKPCMIEKIYFAQPASFEDDMRIQAGRMESGRMLADRMQQKGIEFDAVVPIHASGYPAGRGLAERSGKPIIDAVLTDHFVGRSYTLPVQEQRKVAVSLKHTVIPDEIDGLSVVSTDDSTVRGTTSGVINEGLMAGGAASVDQASASAPFVDSCDLGVDTKSRDLPAAKLRDKPLDEIELYMAPIVKGRTMTYLSREENARAFGREERDVCNFCMGGEHPIRGEQEQFPQRERPIDGKPKLAVFISGNGTNLQKIIDETQSGRIDAEISTVVSNNPDAFGLQRAHAADIPTAVVSSKGRLRDPGKRAQYEQDLLELIQQNPPDALVMAGFMNVLGDEFLQGMQELEIPVLNLHPGLLSPRESERVATSEGLMPVLRGTDAIQQAYDNPKVRVSGVTVHQLLPGNAFDTGPIVLKQEVHKRVDDTPDSWEQRIHDTEYDVLPTAIKRVLHVMKHGIDVSKGEFPW